jgi:hypothetical protein
MRGEAVRILRGALTGALEPDRVSDVAFGAYVAERALEMAAEPSARGDGRDRLGVRLEPAS